MIQIKNVHLKKEQIQEAGKKKQDLAVQVVISIKLSQENTQISVQVKFVTVLLRM